MSAHTQPSAVRGASAESAAVMLSVASVVLFLGVQVLARSSRVNSGWTDVVVFGLGGMMLVTLTRARRENWPVAQLLPGHRVHGPQRTPFEMLTMPLVVVLFTVLPRIEQQAVQEIGAGLRFAIGLLIVAFVRRSPEPWLLVASLVTMLLHPWEHPLSMTAAFVAFILLLLALHASSKIANAAPETSETSETAATSRDVSHDKEPLPHLGSTPRATKPNGPIPPGRHALVAGTILMIVAVSVALAPFARRLIIDPQRFSGQNPDSVVDFGNDSPMKTFGELEASDWLELAYRPSNSDAIVMRMLTNAPAPVFLRAQTFTEWTGRTWQRGTAPSVQRSTRQGSWITRPGAEDDVRKHRRSDRLLPQTIPLGVHRSYISTRVRFRGYTPVPTEPLASIWLGDLDNDVQWFEDGTAAPSGVGPNSYAVLFRPDPSGEVDLNRPDLVSLDRISTRVQDLARSITEDAVTPEDKIQAIRSWMAANIRYDLSIDSPRRGDDPIEHVLFGTRAGSCTHFSTATTALLRSVGIPARVATGFVAQTQRRPGELLVRGKDAHAWAEIPLTNGAWMSVDTTLGAQVNDESRADAFRGPLGVLAIAVGLVAIIALAMAARRRRLLVRLQTPTQRAWTQLHKIGARVGVTPSQSTTMRSYAKSLDERLRSAPLAAHAAAELEAAAFASGGATSQTEMIASVETDLRALDARAKEVRRNERRQRLQRRSRSSRQTSRAERAERAERATNLSVQHNENADESTGIDRS